jgi:hypothetical protein
MATNQLVNTYDLYLDEENLITNRNQTRIATPKRGTPAHTQPPLTVTFQTDCTANRFKS